MNLYPRTVSLKRSIKNASRMTKKHDLFERAYALIGWAITNWRTNNG